MSRLGRLLAVTLLSSSALFVAPAALADHCEPIDNPDPIPGQNTTWCHTPKATPEPEPSETPEPTAKPETPAPATRAPVRTQPPLVRTNPSTPASTPFDLTEVPTSDPLATPQIVVDGPLDDQTNFEVAEPAAGVSSWIFGFIFGFIVGGLVGRASWGLRKRRRQQIFG